MSVVNTFSNGHFEIGINPKDPSGLAEQLTKALGAAVIPPLTTIVTSEGRRIVGDISPAIEDPNSFVKTLVADIEIAAMNSSPDIFVNCLGHTAFIGDTPQSSETDIFEF